MHGSHDHAHTGTSSVEARAGGARKLMWVAVLTALFMLAEFIGGVLSDSLALLSDAGHMFVDASGLMLAALASRVAMRPADARHTFGYRRAEVIGAFVNGTLLCGLVLFIIVESVRRLFVTPEVNGEIMMWLAGGGLLFNIAAGAVLLAGQRKAMSENINLRGALLNVFADALGSVGALIAGALVLWRGWVAADAIVGLVVAALIAFNAVRLLRETVAILLQGVPQHLDVNEVGRAVAAIDGVTTVHDVHIWAMAPGEETVTMHVELGDMDALQRWDEILVEINEVLGRRFGLHHNIIQPELRSELHHDEIQHLGKISDRQPGV